MKIECDGIKYCLNRGDGSEFCELRRLDYIFHCKVGFTTTSFVVPCSLYCILIGRCNHGIMHYDLLLSLTSGHDTTDDLAVTRL